MHHVMICITIVTSTRLVVTNSFKIQPFEFPENATDKDIVNPWNSDEMQSEYELKNPAGDYWTSVVEKLHEIDNGTQFNSWQNRRWPQATLSYFFDTSVSSKVRDLVKTAAGEISRVTCIKFKDWTDAKSSRPKWLVKITSEKEGCYYSHAGYVAGGEMQLNLEKPGCDSIPIVMHEMIHALGFAHEHQRNDRDKHIRIIYDNIKDDKVVRMQFELNKNWEKYTGAVEDAMGFGYDLKSLMHYDAWAFSKCSRDDVRKKLRRCVTMLPKNESFLNLIGQRKGMSRQDVQELHTYYKCTSAGSDVNAGGGPINRTLKACYDQYPAYCRRTAGSVGLDAFKKKYCKDTTWGYYCRGICHDCEKKGMRRPSESKGNRATLYSFVYCLTAVLLYRLC